MRKDKVYDGTPLDWAVYMPKDEGCDEAAKERYKIIEIYLTVNLMSETRTGIDAA